MKNPGKNRSLLPDRLSRKIRNIYRLYSILSNNPAGILISCLFLLTAVTAGLLTKLFPVRATLGNVNEYTVVLDAGHGGDDPGKVSSSGVKEKDVNLGIALKCRSILKQNGIQVILTRDSDVSIEDPGASGKKSSDLRNRKQIITENTPDCAVSIHQNSYPDPSQYGSQVFYQAGNEDSRQLASLIQRQVQYITSTDNRREIKPNSDYYLLKDNPTPTVIAEICFLSNPSEADMITEEYIQERAAFAVAMGIMQYLYS